MGIHPGKGKNTQRLHCYIQDDLMLNESYWDRYKWALRENCISPKDLQVLQNIQDVCHNCAKLKVAQDDLLKTTTCAVHELDKKKKEKMMNLQYPLIRFPICYSNVTTTELEKCIPLHAV
jgi:hypothetical protein